MPNLKLPKRIEDRTKGQSATQIGSSLLGAATAPVMPSGGGPGMWQELIEQLPGGDRTMQAVRKYLPLIPTGEGTAMTQKPLNPTIEQIRQLLKEMAGS